MVRNYKRKTVPPSYSSADLQNAVAAVKNGEVTIYRASKLYKIPKATLYKHVKGQRGVKSKSLGRPTALPAEDEEKIAEGLRAMEKWGFGLSKREVLETIGRYVRENKIETPFKDGVPGDDFFIRFRKTHKLSLKKPQAVEAARKKSIDPFVIHTYFELLKQVTTNMSPMQIWNLDETSFCLDPTRVKVLGATGMPCHRVTSGPAKENITVLLAANAAGEKLPPLIVFRGKNVWDSWMSPDPTAFEGTTYAATKNGWMEAETFTNYFTKNFLQNIQAERPAVLIYDGHASHIGLPLVQKARDENITILKLPPHTSHVLQPLDLSVFRPMKIKWDEELIKWQRKNYGKKLPKSVFSTMIANIWKNLNPTIIKSGFEKGGIFPFSNKVVTPEKFQPEVYERWLSFLESNKTAPRLLAPPALEGEDSQPRTLSPIVLTDRNIENMDGNNNKLVIRERFPKLEIRIMNMNKNESVLRKASPKPSTSYALSEKENESPLSSAFLEEDQLAPETNLDSDYSSQAQPEICSTMQNKPLPGQKKSFEALLLEQVKQVPNVKIGRKRICTGAEIITSAEAMERIAIKEAEKKKTGKSQKKNIPLAVRAFEIDKDLEKISEEEESDDGTIEEAENKNSRKGQKQKKKAAPAEESDEDDEEFEEDESDDGDILDEILEAADDDKFLEVVDRGFESLTIDDWVMVQLSSKKTTKMYVAQISEMEPSLYVKFARRIGLSSTFHWPNVDDTSIITPDEIYKILPPPVIDKRGKIKFNICFDSYSLS